MNKNVDNTKEYKLLSLCTGYGGIELGLELAGFKHRTIAFLEIEAFCCANLVKAMENGAIRPAPIWTDLKTFDAKPFLWIGGHHRWWISMSTILRSWYKNRSGRPKAPLAVYFPDRLYN